jgi:exodeoxyribonuclease VII large subunit
VTSLDSDARHDVIKELEGRGYGFQVTMLGSLVQGANAPRELSAALTRASSLDIDVVLLVRGGGSKSDLAAFDSEEVAEAVGRCRHPVFTGIGHERDVSVADEVASRAFKTPTACASAIVEMVRHFVDELQALWSDIASTAQESIEAAEGQRAELAIAVRDRTRAALAAAEADLREHRTRLIARPREIVRAADARVLNGATRVRLLDPVNTLRRGWSIVRDESGRVVRSVSDISVGDVMVAEFADGSVRSRVEDRVEDGGR